MERLALGKPGSEAGRLAPPSVLLATGPLFLKQSFLRRTLPGEGISPTGGDRKKQVPYVLIRNIYKGSK